MGLEPRQALAAEADLDAVGDLLAERQVALDVAQRRVGARLELRGAYLGLAEARQVEALLGQEGVGALPRRRRLDPPALLLGR